MTGIHKRSPSFLASVVFPDPGRPVTMMHFGCPLMLLIAKVRVDLARRYIQPSIQSIKLLFIRKIPKWFDSPVVSEFVVGVMESVPGAVATGSQLIARIEFARMLPGRYRSRY